MIWTSACDSVFRRIDDNITHQCYSRRGINNWTKIAMEEKQFFPDFNTILDSMEDSGYFDYSWDIGKIVDTVIRDEGEVIHADII